MKELSGRIAVVTGGGSGMGRELVRLLVAEGCSVAMCDVSARGLAETEQAIEYLETEVHMDPAMAAHEVRRYCISPTQPMSYLVISSSQPGLTRGSPANTANSAVVPLMEREPTPFVADVSTVWTKVSPISW